MEIPRCTNLAHAGSEVVRGGWYGKPPHRRQRWWCRPRNGHRPHRFTPTLTRQQHPRATPHGFCLECSTRVEVWEGQAGARRYQFAAREVGEALALVARGATYRDAAFAARRPGGRLPAARLTGRAKRRDAARDGQLVANWVDVFTEPLCAGLLPERWPEIVVIDSVEMRVKSGPRRGEGFHVIGAVGRNPADHGRPPGPLRVWRLEASPVKDAAFERFCRALRGVPRMVISDMDNATRPGRGGRLRRRGRRPAGHAHRRVASRPRAAPPHPRQHGRRPRQPGDAASRSRVLRAGALASVRRGRRTRAPCRRARAAHRAAALDRRPRRTDRAPVSHARPTHPELDLAHRGATGPDQAPARGQRRSVHQPRPHEQAARAHGARPARRDGRPPGPTGSANAPTSPAGTPANNAHTTTPRASPHSPPEPAPTPRRALPRSRLPRTPAALPPRPIHVHPNQEGTNVPSRFGWIRIVRGWV
jgi:hypothetical protein